MILPNRLVWVDIETTGINPAWDHMLEIALVITDDELNVLSSRSICIRPAIDLSHIEQMFDAFMKEANSRNGLMEDLYNSHTDLKRAEQLAVMFLAEELPEGGVSPMCGQSVHFDRSFIEPHMPLLARLFHYRNVDVRTVTQLAERWHPDAYQEPEKKGLHRALPDILDTIAEARYLKDKFFNPL